MAPIGLAVLTFIGYKQTDKQTDKPNLYIDKNFQSAKPVVSKQQKELSSETSPGKENMENNKIEIKKVNNIR